MRRFDEPDGAGALEQLQSLEHDARAEIAAARGEALPPEMMEAANAVLDLGAAIDPAAAERARQELALRAAAPIRARTAQADTADTGLFGQVDAFAVDERGAQSLTDIMGQFDADEAAAKAVRDCL